MKDNELRELLANIESKITASTARVVGSEPKNVIDRLNRIQEIVEQERHFYPPKIVLPSPRVPAIVGMLLGALLFAAGMFAGTFVK